MQETYVDIVNIISGWINDYMINFISEAKSSTEIILKLRARRKESGQWYITITEQGFYISPETPNESTKLTDLGHLVRFIRDYVL